MSFFSLFCKLHYDATLKHGIVKENISIMMALKDTEKKIRKDLEYCHYIIVGMFIVIYIKEGMLLFSLHSSATQFKVH